MVVDLLIIEPDLNSRPLQAHAERGLHIGAHAAEGVRSVDLIADVVIASPQRQAPAAPLADPTLVHRASRRVAKTDDGTALTSASPTREGQLSDSVQPGARQ